jgi:hypothetical protein
MPKTDWAHMSREVTVAISRVNNTTTIKVEDSSYAAEELRESEAFLSNVATVTPPVVSWNPPWDTAIRPPKVEVKPKRTIRWW